MAMELEKQRLAEEQRLASLEKEESIRRRKIGFIMSSLPAFF